MLCEYVLLSLSAIIFFVFVYLGVKKFGLLSCYSAYASKWAPPYASQLNPWQIVTAVSAFLLMPVLIQQSINNPWQFFGFLAPVGIGMVAASPEYATDKFQNVIHQIGAWSTVLFIILYTAFIQPKMLWIIGILLVLSVVMWLWKKNWMFWGEMAMYVATYIILFLMVGGVR